MADAEFAIWQGGLLPLLYATLLGTDGLTTVDLTSAVVLFRFIKNGILLFEAPAVIVGDPLAGRVRYEWRPGDTGAAGLFDAQWRVLTGGTSMMCPGNRYNRVRINAVVT
jgi:hypothetical protein